jgi:hypothetical protein
MTLVEVIRYLNRPLIPFVRRMKARVNEVVTPEVGGSLGDVFQWGTGPFWDLLRNVNIASDAAIDVAKLAAGAAGEVLTTVGANAAWALLVDANIALNAAIQVLKLAPGNENDVVTTVGGVAVWGPAAAGSWETRHAWDFAALATQAFPTSGTPQNLDGIPFTPQGVSGGGATGTVTNTNGTGLTITTTANCTFNGTITGPRLQLDLRDIGPLADFLEGRLRIRIRVTVSPISADFQFFKAGIALFENENVYILGAIGYNAGDGGANTIGLVQHGGVAPHHYLNPEALGSKDVMELRFGAPFEMSFRYGTYSSGWPTVDKPQGVLGSQTYGGVGGFISAWAQQRDTTLGAGAGNTGLRLIMGCSRDSVIAANFTATITHLEIDQWRDGS